MTTGVKAPTDAMGAVAQQWQGAATDLTPGQIDALIATIQGGQWPSQQGLAELLAALQDYKQRYLARAGANGAALAGSANTLAGADKQNATRLGATPLGEAVKLGELGQFLGAFIQPGAQLGAAALASTASVVASGVGTISGLAQAAEGPLTGVVGAVSSANIQHPNHPEGVGNPDVGPSSPGDLNEHVTGPPVTPIHVHPTMHQAR